MTGPRDGLHIAINVEADRLVAVSAHASDGSVRVVGWINSERPADVDASDAEGVGKWLISQLRELGRVHGPVVFAVPRGEVVLKRLVFPPGSSPVELPEMVRLQMVRQLPFAPENAVCDYVPMFGADPQSAAVLAAALQGERVEWRRSIVRAAGLKLARVSLKASGAAAMLADASSRRGGATLGVTIGCGSTEFVVVEDGRMVFARATDLVRPDNRKAGVSAEESASFAARVAVEAKRTWMSYRVSPPPESGDVVATLVLGDDELCREVSQRCEETMQVPAATIGDIEQVRWPDDMPATDRASTAPLVGLLAEPLIGSRSFDFAKPRRAPDSAAATRRKALLGALAVIVLGGSGYTMASLGLSSAGGELEAIKGEYQRQTGEYNQFIRDQARMEHIRRWTGAGPDWIAHLVHLSDQMADPREAQLDQVGGRAAARVDYVPPTDRKFTAEGKWGTSMAAVFGLRGQVRDRSVADAVRAALVADDRYSVQSQGPDVPDRFDWQVTTTRRTPEEDVKQQGPPETGQAGKDAERGKVSP